MAQANSRNGVDPYGQEVANLLNQLDKIAKSGRVSKAMAVAFIEKSAWWLTHVSGPVRAPGYASRMEGNESSWRLTYGANTFHVTRAIVKCSKELQKFLQKNRDNPKFTEDTLTELKQCLSASVCGCVSGYGGQMYDQYRMDKDEMVFGAQAINVKEFINCFFEVVPVDRFIVRHLQFGPFRQSQSRFKFSKVMKKEFDQAMSAITRSDQIEHALLTLQSADNILRDRFSARERSVFSALAETLRKHQNDIRPLTSLLFSLFSNQGSNKEPHSAKPLPKIMSQLRNVLALAGFAIPIDDKRREQQGANDGETEGQV